MLCLAVRPLIFRSKLKNRFLGESVVGLRSADNIGKRTEII